MPSPLLPSRFQKYRHNQDHARVARLLIAALVLLLMYPGLGWGQDRQAKDPETMISQPLKVGIYQNTPKVYMDEAGEPAGFFPEILNVIAAREGWQLDYLPCVWDQCLADLQTGKLDLMVDVAYSAKRQEIYDLNEESVFINWGLLYTAAGVKVDSFLDLQGKRIAVMKGSIHTDGEGGIKDLVKKFNIDCQFIEVNNYQEVFELLDSGGAEAGVVNRLFGNLSENDYQVDKTSLIFNPRHLKFALPKDRPQNRAIIQRLDFHLGALKKESNSVYHRIIASYLSGVPYKELDHHKDGLVALTGQEKAWIKAHPVIRLGVDPEFVPFEYISEDGTYSGLASEYIKILNQRLGLSMEIVPKLSWAEVVAKSKKMDLDVLPCVGKTKERLSYLNYSKPYIQFQRVILTRTDFPFVAGMDDLRNLRVAVQANTSHDGFLQESTEITPLRFPTLQDSLAAVSTGKADALIANIAAASYWIRHMNLTNLKVAAPAQSQTLDLHFAVRKDWPELVAIINKGLASITEVEKNALVQKWVSVTYEPGIATKKVIAYILRIIGGAIVLLMIILFWNYRLKKEVVQRQAAEEKLAHYAHELEEANVHLQSLDKLKSMFIASMSHELRTPLNSIIGFTGIILQGMTGEINERQKDQLGRVYRSAKHLLSLITDVIDISKVEAGRIEVYPEPCSLTELIDAAVENIQPQLKAKNLTLEIDAPAGLQLITDRKRLLQCLINYLSNAVKFTEQGGVRFKATDLGDHVEIAVTDTGIGIARADLPKLFEAFERLETHLRVKAGGTGLGLYLTKKIATELLEGEIWVESEDAKGSTFGIRIPKTLVKHGEEPEHARPDH
ncbi:MAG: transporter substrate-binding domain-containing protein [Proteobacteria bacterium]|nr:transporter substrate-binding domain-containing protein [Pseudomonadota bacterium]